MNARPDWDPYFLGIAKAAAARGDCRRSQVAAILVGEDRRVHGTGYNGSYPGGPSCLKGECPRGLKSYDEVEGLSAYDGAAGGCIAIHAELNLILYTSPDERRNGTIYITREPCEYCLRFLKGSGVRRIVFPGGDYYRLGRATWEHNLNQEALL